MSTTRDVESERLQEGNTNQQHSYTGSNFINMDIVSCYWKPLIFFISNNVTMLFLHLLKAFLQICNKLNRTTPLVKDNTTIDNNSAYNELRKICEQNIIPSYTCHLNMESSVRWIEYGVTVAFTIGEKINMNL